MATHRTKRKILVGIVAAALAVGSSVAFAQTRAEISTNPRPRLVCVRQHHRTVCHWGTPTSTTSVNPSTTVSSTTSTSTTSSTTSTTQPAGSCIGVPLTQGQADLNARPAGTTFCLSGVHNWDLNPKSGDTISGGVLDGGGTTHYAFEGSAANVTLDGLEVRNYAPANQQGAIAAVGSGWVLKNLQVHDNGVTGNGEKWGGSVQPTGGGGGSTLGDHWQFLGGRFYNNRQWGLGGNGTGTVLDGVEIDHNNFADDTYQRRNIDCDFEAGGLKWVNDNLTIKNSSVHDNACRGIWADITGNQATITGNHVYNNWADGIMIEISSGATITGNLVTGNGYREWATAPGTQTQGCAWQYGAGIFLSTSSLNNVSGNTVTGNCLGITGAQQNRGSAYPILENNQIHDNVVSGGGRSGMAADDGTNLATKNDIWTNNQFTNGAIFCGLSC